jgi:pimeloyl-ACP methyl ester carboxylesterase
VSLTSVKVSGDAGAIETAISYPPKATSTGRLLLLCHGLPLSTGGGRIASQQLPELAERFSAEVGWAVAVASLRGVGASPGTFSASGWRADLAAVISALGPQHDGIVLAGFGFGGALTLATAVEDDSVRGVATMATPADLASWCGPAAHFAEACARAGVVGREPLLEAEALLADVLALDPVGSVASLGRRRLMIIHGADDRIVPVAAARQLVESAGGRAELRIIPGAGHWLRPDPRMVATLTGWLDRMR